MANDAGEQEGWVLLKQELERLFALCEVQDLVKFPSKVHRKTVMQDLVKTAHLGRCA